MEWTGDFLSAVVLMVFYAITLIPAFIVATYIVGREKDKRFSTKQLIALAIALMPFMFFLLK